MTDKVVPVVKADEPEAAEEEELVDHLVVLREKCHESPVCQTFWNKFQECQDRVSSRSKTNETCEEELIDYINVRDKCVNKDLWKLLK